MAARRPPVDGDPTVRVGVAEHAEVRTAEGLEPERRRLRHLARSLDLVIEEHEHAETTSLGRSGHAYRVQEVEARVRAEAGGRPLRAHEHDGRLDLEGEIEKVRGLLERGGPVRDHDAVERRLATDRVVHRGVEREPVARADRRASHGAESNGDDLGGLGRLREPLEELVGLRLAARVHVLPEVQAPAADRRDRPAGADQRDPALHLGRASTSAACFSTTVPLKKSGFSSPHRRTAFSNTKSRKSFSSRSPCSTSSYASGTTSVMSGTSKWPMSELKNALSRACIGFALRLKAHALIGSSASQPK